MHREIAPQEFLSVDVLFATRVVELSHDDPADASRRGIRHADLIGRGREDPEDQGQQRANPEDVGPERFVKRCSPGPRLEMFARHYRHGWSQWGDQVEPAPLQLVTAPTEITMPSRFADAAYAYMKSVKQTEVFSNELWAAMLVARPDLTTKSETRKTPRTTMMRDLRKDERFVVGSRRVALAKK